MQIRRTGRRIAPNLDLICTRSQHPMAPYDTERETAACKREEGLSQPYLNSMRWNSEKQTRGSYRNGQEAFDRSLLW